MAIVRACRIPEATMRNIRQNRFFAFIYNVVGIAGMHMDAENTHQVFEWLWSSGQLSEGDIRSLPSHGISAVINLALPTSSNALPGEAELVTGHGMAYVQIPVEWENPKLEAFLQFVGVLNAFAGRNVWVHCAKNMRVSAFIYLYRKLVLSEADEQASIPMQDIWQPNGTWQAFIHEVCAAYSDHSLQVRRS